MFQKISTCQSGGIGRRAGPRSLYFGVRVRLPPLTPCVAVAERLKAPDCRSGDPKGSNGGSNPSRYTICPSTPIWYEGLGSDPRCSRFESGGGQNEKPLATVTRGTLAPRGKDNEGELIVAGGEHSSSVPGWRNWNTRWPQAPVLRHEGSTPSPGTMEGWPMLGWRLLGKQRPAREGRRGSIPLPSAMGSGSVGMDAGLQPQRNWFDSSTALQKKRGPRGPLFSSHLS